jgi:hypothetical protein
MKVGPGAVVRGTGVALACLATDESRRSPILLAGFACGWLLDRPGLQLATVVPNSLLADLGERRDADEAGVQG